MNGAQHFIEAKRLLGYAEARDAEQRGDETDMSFLAEAQVHATLALAAATAMQPSRYPGGRPESEAWCAAAGVQKPEATE